MRAGLLALLLASLLPLAACQPAAPPPRPQYLVGPAWQAGGMWYYPREQFAAVATGLAAIDTDPRPRLTADGERFDPNALAAAHQTLQLPAIVRVTNLETGLALVVRVNDRGPASPARLLALTPRAAALLGISGPAQIRIEVLEADSHAAAEALGGGPRVAVDTAPLAAIRADALPPPPGARGAAGPQAAAPPIDAAAPAAPAPLPQAAVRVPVQPGLLWIDAGRFASPDPAARQRARIASLGARVDRLQDGRTRAYDVRIGPLGSVADADAVLDQAIRAGVVDARIVVE